MSEQKKICTKCKAEKLNTTEFFHLDKGKTVSACKVCKNEKKRIQSIEYRNKIASEYGSVYQKRKLTDVEFLEKHKLREKKYKEKRNERCRKRWRDIPDIKVKHSILNKKRTKKEVNELPDHYIARLITRHSKILKPTDLLNQTEFLNTYRINLKLKRLCKELTI